jgi:RNA polymerase sigma-70 factor (ECF subfamily)
MFYDVVDGRLVERARQGDQTAFAVLVERYQRPIVRYLAHVVHAPDAAPDLAQETFVRAWHALHTAPPTQTFRPWLYRLATNIAYDHLRRRPRVRVMPLDDVHRALPLVPAPAPEERDAVRAALAALRPADRAVLVLIGGEGYSFVEAARVLGSTPDAIRKRFSRAKVRFRAAYDAD